MMPTIWLRNEHVATLCFWKFPEFLVQTEGDLIMVFWKDVLQQLLFQDEQTKCLFVDCITVIHVLFIPDDFDVPQRSTSIVLCSRFWLFCPPETP